MLLGGLWHGASWNFVIWGGYHGALLSIERILGVGKQDPGSHIRWTRVVLTFGLVCIGWVFFRAATLHDSFQVLDAMFSTTLGTNLILPWQLWMAAVTLLLAVAEEKQGWFEGLVKAPAMVYATAIVLLLFCLELLGLTGKTVPFVYFQF
jgi:D-alanyl-lipoteichoic acid acyltransferase DltB (MBOAT superfamily)